MEKQEALWYRHASFFMLRSPVLSTNTFFKHFPLQIRINVKHAIVLF
ncbi:hypothetical protein EI42_06109 [Thermosporothrix hazakensis]|uniref:Uncharacterized protein n=1 Tax=Thermosporothrix hazakensis TaxID=644383 RepID=A0A326TTX4_THEHA|nr:hypothetical protein [Thermosporothrix hazakensis]PZW19355.1 hypothetical protein EI42_06109 [Thermosporothrix hazakensis]